MWAACATRPPSASKSAHEKSRRSLMFGESAVRPRTTPISSAMLARRWWAISSATGSTSTAHQLEEKTAQPIDGQTPTGRHERRRAVLADDGGTAEATARDELVTAMDRGRVGPSIEHDPPHPRACARARTSRRIGRYRCASTARPEAERHDLDRTVGVGMAEEARVRPIEGGPPSPLPRYRDL